MKVVGVVKSIVGTDAVIAIDEDGNQRAIFPGDTLYDNEKLLELSGVQVNVEPVTVADAQKKSEPKSDKEVASLQDALLNGKDISELEETAAGGNAGGGNASSDGVSLGAASFVASGHESSIHADASAISEVAPASVAGVTNVSGGIYDVSVQVTDPAGNWVAPIKLPVTEAPIVQPVAPAPSEPAHISDNIFEITRMYTDEDSDLRTSYTPSYPNTTDGFDFKPTFEGKATAFADIALSIAKQGNYNWALGKNNPDIPVDVLTTKADADGNWKVEAGKDYAQGSHRISADVTNTDGNTYHSTSEAFYMPTDPFIVEPVDHL